MATSIKALPPDERPRERLLRHGPTVLGDAEVVAILIGHGGPGQSALELARALLADGWGGLARRSVEELVQVRGLGPAKAAVLLAALEVGRRVRLATAGEAIGGPQDVLPWVSDMERLTQEEFRVLLLNTKHRVLAVETVFRGGLNSVEVFPREVFRRAVAHSAAAVIAVHNHPSGDPTPSPEDRALTVRLEQAGAVMGIPVLDHLIVGHGRHVSLRDHQVTELR
ncbi:MAG: DNA repair protein RadC [Firmicutes bacterium]|nr:DNA repair protein RadC [Alicyclobacillaceae bacterium]MCL6496987.1 DNA repair protein RadC [Bacillota bacterium]